MTDKLIDRQELAAKLGQTVAWTYKHLANLRMKKNFPREVLHSRWSEAAIDLWMAQQSGVAREVVVTGDPSPATGYDALLDRNAARLAGHE